MASRRHLLVDSPYWPCAPVKLSEMSGGGDELDFLNDGRANSSAGVAPSENAIESRASTSLAIAARAVSAIASEDLVSIFNNMLVAFNGPDGASSGSTSRQRNASCHGCKRVYMLSISVHDASITVEWALPEGRSRWCKN